MVAEAPQLESVIIEPHPAGDGFRLHGLWSTIGNFGLPYRSRRLLPERFQTVEGAEAFARGTLRLEGRRIRIATPRG